MGNKGYETSTTRSFISKERTVVVLACVCDYFGDLRRGGMCVLDTYDVVLFQERCEEGAFGGKRPWEGVT